MTVLMEHTTRLKDKVLVRLRSYQMPQHLVAKAPEGGGGDSAPGGDRAIAFRVVLEAQRDVGVRHLPVAPD